MNPIIEAEGLSKSYMIGRRESYGSLREEVMNSLRGVFSRTGGANRQAFWALKDLSFKVSEGEVFGIIGRNGAGKSTLLKVLSRITEPTEGRVVMRGRAASLLEVGTGFHTELTGRENIFLNGALLGMTSAEIRRKFDEIVAFSGTGEFIDTPVKRYSSGMFVRLAFAVAAHLEPEILIIDEVLAVGDSEFQKKCMGKIGEAAKGGRTILFVSHDMEAVQRLCGRCALMDRGRIVSCGQTREVVRNYLEDKGRSARGAYRREAAESADSAVLKEASIVNSSGREGAEVLFGEPFSIRMVWENRTEVRGISYSIRVHDPFNRFLFAVNTIGKGHLRIEGRGAHEVVCRIAPNFLIPGDYSFNIGAYIRPHTRVHSVDPCLEAAVSEVPFRPGHTYNISGTPIVAVDPEWAQV